MCPVANKAPELKWFGFAIDGKGFYSMDNIPPLPLVQPENLAYVLVDDPWPVWRCWSWVSRNWFVKSGTGVFSV
jgi:hypothetical protein